MEFNNAETSLHKIWVNLSNSEDSFISTMISKWGNKIIKFILIIIQILIIFNL